MLCSKENCTGCFSCYNICPKNAISMKEDNTGAIYPVVNESKCISCGLCQKVCPSINTIKLKYPSKCYAMKAKDNRALLKSSSGAASALIAEAIINQGGIVYGVTFEKGFQIKHIRIDNKEDLYKIKGSKYVHAYVNNAFKNIKTDLNKNLKVLFVGTPCQVAGLKNYLMKEYDNLYTIDIICHGVPAQKKLKDHLSNLIKEYSIEEIDTLTFRTKNNYAFTLTAMVDNNIVYSKTSKEDEYYYGFLNGIFYRENCYKCKYSNIERVSDLTIGDFWGLSAESELYKDKSTGISILLPCSEKGEKMIDDIKENICIEERPIEEGIKGNAQLNHPVNRKKRYKKFEQNYIKYGFTVAFKKCTTIRTIKIKLKKIKLVNRIINKIRS